MPILLVGLNYRTAPMDIRERLAVSDEKLPAALRTLSSHHLLETDGLQEIKTSGECVILSTCNRLEVYATASNTQSGWETIEKFLLQIGNLDYDVLHDHLYFMVDDAVVKHLMYVSSGLDSMILGEPQIVGQISDAFSIAQKAQTTRTILSHLFTEALHIGKRARTETVISRHSTSVSHIAIQLIQEKVQDLASAQIVIIGAGETAILAVKALRMYDAQHIICVNRTREHAETLALQAQGEIVDWQDRFRAIDRADIVISTTSAPNAIITATDMINIMAGRSNRNITIVDLAVPRDVETAVGEMKSVHLYDIDDLQSVLDANLAQRQAAIPQVEVLIQAGVKDFLMWLQSRQIVPVIVNFRTKVAALADTEVKLALERMEGLNPHSQQAVVRLAHRIVNKMLHEPTERLKVHAASGDGSIYAQVIQDLFALNPSTSIAEQTDSEVSISVN